MCAALLRLACAVVAIVLAVPSVAVVRAGTGSAASVSIAGTWRFDRSQSKDGSDVWRRRLDAMRADEAAAAASSDEPSALRLERLMESPDWRLRAALRDLLEVADRLTFSLDAGRVTITDDLDRSRTYATDGTKEKRQLAATEFQARTSWNGSSLVQDIVADRLTLAEVYLPAADGQSLLLSITIVKPKFEPPIAPMTRIYARQP